MWQVKVENIIDKTEKSNNKKLKDKIAVYRYEYSIGLWKTKTNIYSFCIQKILVLHSKNLLFLNIKTTFQSKLIRTFRELHHKKLAVAVRETKT